jgi:hypothetical protein
MKTLIFKIQKSTQEEMHKACLENKGQPWMYAYHLDYWMNNKMIMSPDGTFFCSSLARLDELIGFIEKKERLL